MSFILTPAWVGSGVLAAIPLSPVYLLAYAFVGGFLYLMFALAFDLPLPGAKPEADIDDEPPPVYRGRGGPKS